jgi:hypothetical protein
MKITNKTKLGKIIEIEGAHDVLSKHSVPCVSCPMAQFEMNELTIGQICDNYGINEKELLDELNKLKK